jgi:hypothetical protein
MKNPNITSSSFTRQSTKNFCLIIILLFSVVIVKAQGNLLLFPKRVVFEGPVKMQALSLINTGTDTVNYLISLVQYRMREDGVFEKITSPDPEQQFAGDYIRIYPRHILLPPNKAQTVKVQLNNINELKSGEYRSHLYKKPLGEKETVKDSTAISVTITSVFGVSIPVIIRVGESTTQLSIMGTKPEVLNDSLLQLKIVINRSGNMSAYGDIAVDHISDQGKITRLATLNGLAVYTPYPKRIFLIPLTKNTGLQMNSGKLHISYKTQADAKSILLAETDLPLSANDAAVLRQK